MTLQTWVQESCEYTYSNTWGIFGETLLSCLWSLDCLPQPGLWFLLLRCNTPEFKSTLDRSRVVNGAQLLNWAHCPIPKILPFPYGIELKVPIFIECVQSHSPPLQRVGGNSLETHRLITFYYYPFEGWGAFINHNPLGLMGGAISFAELPKDPHYDPMQYAEVKWEFLKTAFVLWN